jgi:uncharacterized protein YaaW (UPF0174 family)
MITLNHTVNLVTEIDEFKMPSHLLNTFLSLSEEQMEQMLRGAFVDALEGEGFIDKINENNQWAVLKVGKN